MKNIVSFLIIISISTTVFSAKNNYTINGKLEKWDIVRIDFTGPIINATDNQPNPFLDYRLNVIFTSPSGRKYSVPGFFNGDGNGAYIGNIWSVRFIPDEIGKWKFVSSFRQGKQIAVIEEEGVSVAFDGQKGKLTIKPTDTDSQGFHKLGRLEYVGKHYYKFADDGYWIKGGADSPEDFLAYDGFVNTQFASHSYSAHKKHWNSGDPDWENGKGKGIIGALNYLSENHVNSIYFLPMNIGGDGKNVWPFLGKIDRKGNPENDNLHYDIKKLEQWEYVFAHAQKKGIFLHFVLNEAEKNNKMELDEATLGVERKLFYREMVARFSHHLALQWNLCEEYNLQYKLSPSIVKSFASYINKIDPYKHSITVHHAGDCVKAWTPFLNDPLFTVTSFQIHTRNTGIIELWYEKSDSVGFPQIVSMDELFPDKATVKNVDRYRREYIWPIYLSGGQLELILDELVHTDDFSLYHKSWEDMWYARKFLKMNAPFWDMHPSDELLEGEAFYEGKQSRCYGKVFAKKGEVYAIYLPNSKETGKLNLTEVQGKFVQKWYNPRTGEFEKETKDLTGGKWIELGLPPSSFEEDWATLIVKVL